MAYRHTRLLPNPLRRLSISTYEVIFTLHRVSACPTGYTRNQVFICQL